MMSRKHKDRPAGELCPPSRTICWHCANAVPKTVGARVGGKLIRGCAWSVYGCKVDGWNAIEYQVKMGTIAGVEQYVTSYEVLDCPEFVKG